MVSEFEDGTLSSVIGIDAESTITGDEAPSFLFSRHVVAVADDTASCGWLGRRVVMRT